MSKNQQTQNYKINNQINSSYVRLKMDNGTEVLSMFEVKRRARELELDIIEISPNAQPPVVIIADFQKFLYQKKKEEKEQKQHKNQVKEIRLTSQIGEHDYQTKLRHAIEFLSKNNKIKMSVFFKGRSIVFKDQGEILLLKFATDLEDVGKPESLPKLEGKRMTMTMTPKNK